MKKYYYADLLPKHKKKIEDLTIKVNQHPRMAYPPEVIYEVNPIGFSDLYLGHDLINLAEAVFVLDETTGKDYKFNYIKLSK